MAAAIMTNKPKILLAVCGTNAARIVPTIIAQLMSRYEVKLICTKPATKLMNRWLLENVNSTHLYVEGDQWDYMSFYSVPLYTRLVEWADALVILPLSANTIFKVAHGCTDGLIPSVYSTSIGARIPVFVAPEMDEGWWNSGLIQTNVARLVGDRVRFITQSCHIDPDKIVDMITTALDEVPALRR